eukprot:2318229-Rhodomonas_salina.3
MSFAVVRPCCSLRSPAPTIASPVTQSRTAPHPHSPSLSVLPHTNYVLNQTDQKLTRLVMRLSRCSLSFRWNGSLRIKSRPCSDSTRADCRMSLASRRYTLASFLPFPLSPLPCPLPYPLALPLLDFATPRAPLPQVLRGSFFLLDRFGATLDGDSSCHVPFVTLVQSLVTNVHVQTLPLANRHNAYSILQA